MRKLLIVVGVLGIVLVAVVVIALLNLNSFLNRNREWLGQQVETALGRKVSFSEIGVSFSGGVGVRIRGLHVADDPAFSKDDFVRAEDVQVAVKLLPTLMGHPEVKRIVLLSPEVTVIKTKDGNNYDSIGKAKAAAPSPQAPAPAATPAAPPKQASGSEKAAFVVALIDVRDGNVHYVDRTASPPTDLRLGDLDFSASDVSFDTPIRFRFATALFGAKRQNVSLDGKIGPLGAEPDLQKAPIDVDLKLGPIVVDQLKGLAAVKQAIPPELSLPDPVTLEASAKGTMPALALTAKLDGTDASIRYGESFRKPKGVPFKFELAAERAGERVEVKKLLLALAELELEGKGRLTTGKPGSVDFTIDSKKTPLAGWDKLMPAFAGHEVSGTVEVHVRAQGKTAGGEMPRLTGTVALADVAAKQKGSPYEIEGLTTKIELKGDSLALPPTNFKLSGSPVALAADVSSFKPLAATFALSSPEISAASLNFASPTATKPEVLRGLDVKGRFHAGERGPDFDGTLRSSSGSLRGFDYQTLAADVALRDQIAVLDKLSLHAFDGNYTGGGRYDMRDPAAPRFDFRSSVRGMDLKALLASQQSSFQEKIAGRLDADLSLDGVGKEWERVKNSLRGNGQIDVRDGVLRDVNLADQVLASVTGIGGLSNLISPRVRRKYPDIFSTGDTKFEKLGGSVQIAERIARSEDLTLAARDYAILGRGTYDLDNQLDFLATLVASRQLSDDIISDVREVKYIANEQGKVEIPFRLTGALPRVKPKPDGEFLTRALSRAAVGKGTEELQKRIFGKPKPGQTPKPEQELLRKGIEGLFGH